MSLDLIHSSCDDCNIDNCVSLQRLSQILTKYNEWLSNKTQKQNTPNFNSVMNELFTSYSNKNIIDDYIHIKEMNYDSSSHNILCSQSLLECIPSNRHRRNNHSNHSETYFTSDIKNILLQKLLDQVHLFLYHDLTTERKNNEQDFNSENRFGTTVEQVHTSQQVVEEKHHDTNEEENKYNDTNDDEKQNEVLSRFSIDVDLEKDAYNFGQQFFYWNYYKTHKWFIQKKYDNLKDELLN
eukprot:277825_1